MPNNTRIKSNPTLQAVPTPEEPLPVRAIEREIMEQLAARAVASAMAKRGVAGATPEGEPSAASLWALVPKKWRPVALVGLLLLIGGNGSWLAYGRRAFALPAEVDVLRRDLLQLQAQHEEVARTLEELARAPRGPGSAPLPN